MIARGSGGGPLIKLTRRMYCMIPLYCMIPPKACGCDYEQEAQTQNQTQTQIQGRRPTAV